MSSAAASDFVPDHPAFVSPRGDVRERPVPCACCGVSTWALRGVCVRCDEMTENKNKTETNEENQS